MQAPKWFSDNAATPILSLLEWFLQRLKKQSAEQRLRSLSLTLNIKTIPALFNYNELEEIDYLWTLILELSLPPYSIWDIEPYSKSKKTIPDKFTPETQISLVFKLDKEAFVRLWLDIPLVAEEDLQWHAALREFNFKHIQFSYCDLEKIRYPGTYSPQIILQGLDLLKSLTRNQSVMPLSWRQLSAQFFVGDSKYLDSPVRQQWLLTLIPELADFIQTRRLLLNVHLVAEPQGILLIENYDTFCLLRARSQKLSAVQHLHLVYSQGFMASTQRVRDKNLVLFSFSGAFKKQQDFEQQWHSVQAAQKFSMYFWGDLDFAGLQILNALSQQFSNIVAWRPGYTPMLKALINGVGHSAIEANKEGQSRPLSCACNFAQVSLLPALIASERFIDQEWLRLELLGTSF